MIKACDSRVQLLVLFCACFRSYFFCVPRFIALNALSIVLSVEMPPLLRQDIQTSMTAHTNSRYARNTSRLKPDSPVCVLKHEKGQEAKYDY